ncbi:GNAT family N-acetyltransferase [Streptomyces sp. NPDC095613]|uniref:GNAT family N-acetyltransferase n=1 Tax=Streptomyces sp. NPDC095613 TaxID=3155540 RepID=UPI00331C7270
MSAATADRGGSGVAAGTGAAGTGPVQQTSGAGLGHAVRVAVGPADLAACFAVRKEVFVVEQGVAEDLEYDGRDGDAVHVLAVRADGQPLGTGRLLYGPGAADRTGGDPAVGSLGRLAVTAAARGLGIGAALVRAIEEAARGRGLAAVDLHAQSHALGFYERLGYVAYGPEFLDADMPHRAMRREL